MNGGWKHLFCIKMFVLIVLDESNLNNSSVFAVRIGIWHENTVLLHKTFMFSVGEMACSIYFQWVIRCEHLCGKMNLIWMSIGPIWRWNHHFLCTFSTLTESQWNCEWSINVFFFFFDLNDFDNDRTSFVCALLLCWVIKASAIQMLYPNTTYEQPILIKQKYHV